MSLPFWGSGYEEVELGMHLIWVQEIIIYVYSHSEEIIVRNAPMAYSADSVRGKTQCRARDCVGV